MSSRTPIAGSSDESPTAELALADLIPTPNPAPAYSARTHERTLPLRPVAGRVLYVASTGGHLAELNRLSARFDALPDSVWVTFDSQQSRSVLDGRNVRFVPYVSPRDLVGTLRAFRRIFRLMRAERFDSVVSTGAAVALGAYVAAKLLRVPAVYVESVARVSGPSLTGRIVAALRLAQLRTQHASWASPRWQWQESVLNDFRSVPSLNRIPASPRLFVTLGTIRPYRFDALIDAVLRTGLANEHTVWQVGITTRTDLPGRVVEQLGHEEFLAAAAAADVVVTHAGVGTVLELLEHGTHPVVVPRSRNRGEHVDDHQHEIAEYLRTIDVATVLEVDEITVRRIREAAAARTLSR
jgi:UDP-N-acetylglucosamine transferase subunit ALG13